MVDVILSLLLEKAKGNHGGVLFRRFVVGEI